MCLPYHFCTLLCVLGIIVAMASSATINTKDLKPNQTTLPVTYVEGKRYLLSTHRISYFEAIEVCDGYGMQLVKIPDKKKNDEIFNLVKQSTVEGAWWMAANDLSDGKTWTWSDGTPVTYFNWSANEPNNWKQVEFCIDMYKTGFWNDQPCEHDMYFICEDVDKPVKANCCCGCK